MSSKEKRTIENLALSLGSGVTDQTATGVKQLRTDMDTVIGISVVANVNTGITRATLSITDEDGAVVFIDTVNVKSLEVSTNIAPAERYYPVNFPAQGKRYKATLVTTGTTGAACSWDVQFHEIGEHQAQ